MKMLGYDFFVYTDAETEEFSIVYRRKDGRYDLIETAELKLKLFEKGET